MDQFKEIPLLERSLNFQNTHTVVLLLLWNLSGTTQVSRYQKVKNQDGKTNLD